MDTDGFEATKHPGLTVSGTYVRAEQGSKLKFTEVREYAVDRRLLMVCDEVYVLSYDEVNEESAENLIWETTDEVAYRFVAAE